MKLTLQTKAYTQHCHGKPWIARVDFSVNELGEFHYGEWCGQPGEAGELYLEAEEGDVVAQGQKAHASGVTNRPQFGIVSSEGLVQWCNSKIEAKVMHLALKGREQPCAS